jgi:hypothetical protein
LQIRELLKLEREALIRDRLGKLPKDLKATYNEIFESIMCQDDGKPEIAIRAMRWVMCSTDPFYPHELVAAACQDPYTDEPNMVDVDIHFVLSACQNLLEMRAGEIAFSHLSVQEYCDEL